MDSNGTKSSCLCWSKRVPQTMLQVKLNAHSGSSSAMGIRNRVPRYSFSQTLSSIAMSGNDIETSL